MPVQLEDCEGVHIWLQQALSRLRGELGAAQSATCRVCAVVQGRSAKVQCGVAVIKVHVLECKEGVKSGSGVGLALQPSSWGLCHHQELEEATLLVGVFIALSFI